MSKDINIVQVENSTIGTYYMILTSDQLKELGKTGAAAIENAGIQNQPTTTSSGRITVSPDSQGNHEGGFIGNTTDWSQFFPNEQNAQVPELIAKAKKWEDNFSLAIKSLAAFVGAGLGTYTSGGNITGLKNISVNSILGPFVDLYATDNPIGAKYLKELISNLTKLNN